MFDSHRTRVIPSVTAALAWGAMFPIAATALHHVAAFPLTALRYGIATLIFVAVLVGRDGVAALKPEGRSLELFVLGSIGFAGFNLLTYLGLEYTRAQDASLIVASQPLITVLVLWAITRNTPPKATLAAIGVALLGVVLVITRGQPSALIHGSGHGGDLMILIGAFGWVIYTLGARRFPHYSPLRYTTQTAVGGTLTIFAATAVIALIGSEPLPSGHDLGAVWPQIVYVVLAGGVLGVLAWNEGIRRLGAANGALFINLVPVVTFAITIAQGYRPGLVELGGALLTLVALVGANLAGRQAIRRPSSSAWAATRAANPAKSRP